MARKRKPTICEACGYGSYAGRVCRECKAFYGSAEDAIAGSALARRMAQCVTFEDVLEALGELVDVVVIDWPGVSLPRIIHGGSARPIGRADQVEGNE